MTFVLLIQIKKNTSHSLRHALVIKIIQMRNSFHCSEFTKAINSVINNHKVTNFRCNPYHKGGMAHIKHITENGQYDNCSMLLKLRLSFILKIQ